MISYDVMFADLVVEKLHGVDLKLILFSTHPLQVHAHKKERGERRERESDR